MSEESEESVYQPDTSDEAAFQGILDKNRALMDRDEETLDVNLACIHAFVIAASHSSLAEAARSCGIKEDTFRKRIDALEAWANVCLMQRRPEIILSPVGMMVLPHALKMCEAAQNFQRDARHERRRNIIVGSIRRPDNGGFRRRNTRDGAFIEID